MGYYTNYTLEQVNYEVDWSEVTSLFTENMKWQLGEDGSGGDYCKWYEHEIEMKEVSKIFPTTIFKLTGEGEYAGDLWIKYFKNGKMQKCKAEITFAPFNENELK